MIRPVNVTLEIWLEASYMNGVYCTVPTANSDFGNYGEIRAAVEVQIVPYAGAKVHGKSHDFAVLRGVLDRALRRLSTAQGSAITGIVQLFWQSSQGYRGWYNR